LSDTTSGKRLDWVDALRGYAISSVIAYHTFQELPNLDARVQKVLDFGSMGVQLFFMVSAFTIFLTLDEAEKKNRLSFKAFYIRRALRIMPLFYLTLAISAGLVLHAKSAFPYAGFFSTLTFTSAWIPSLCPTLVPGGWSIAVEMWFYLLAPLAFTFIRNVRHALYFILAALILRFSINEGLILLVDPKPALFSSFIYFWLPDQLPIFALGILAFFLYRRGGTEVAKEAEIPPLLFLLFGGYLLAASVQGFKVLIPFHFLFGLSFLLIMLFMMSKPANVLANRPLVGLGKISYSAYVSHFFAIRYTHGWFLEVLRGETSSVGLQFAAYLALIVLLTVLASMFLYRFVERPGQAFGKYLIRRYAAA
jgi:peptidoglycan/LPS O-acetylase OafA/YrhL